VFKNLDLDDRIALVQESVYSVAILNLSRDFNLETKEYNFFSCTKSEEEKIVECFPQFASIKEDLLYVGHLIKTVEFDEIEITCLTGLLTFNAGKKNSASSMPLCPREKIIKHILYSPNIYLNNEECFSFRYWAYDDYQAGKNIK
jgi:hypothetical protein